MKVFLLHISGQSESFHQNLARAYFTKLQEDGLAKHAFYDGSVYDAEDFINLAFSQFIILYLVLDMTGDLPQVAGHCHLNGFQGRMAVSHFSMSEAYQGKKGIELGRAVSKELFKQKRQDGGPLVTSLLGLTPMSNRLACRYAQLIGFKKQLIIKDACEFADGHFEDAMVSKQEVE